MATSSRSLLDPRTASMASLVRSLESGHKWLYVSRVSEALAWPSRAWTVVTDSPCRMSSEG